MEALNKLLHMTMPLIVSIAGTSTVVTAVWNQSPIGSAINPYLSGAISQKAAKPAAATPAQKCRVIDGEKYCK
jgi:hypothetical protein